MALMARNEMPVIIEFFDSSDEENIINPPLHAPIVVDDNNEYELRIFHELFGFIQRVQHIKIYNYIENIVSNYDDRDFIMHFRISRAIAYNLIDRFRVSQIFTSLQDRGEHLKITAEKHILCFLWFVGHEAGSYRDVADRFGIAISTLYWIITRVTDFIMYLAPNIIKYPTAAEKEETSTYFLQEKGFPGVIGAVDGSHIRIDKPLEDADSYINRKQYFSLHVQGTVNHNLKFIDIFVGYPGSVHDARVLKNSTMYNDLHQLCGDNYFLLGDSAYPCLAQLIVPYKDNGHLTRAQRTFNQKLSSCRIIIENAFGCLKQRFRQLYHFKLRNIPRLVLTIHACCVLHNMANLQDLEFLEPPVDDAQADFHALNQHIVHNEEQRQHETGVHKRDELCQLINSL